MNRIPLVVRLELGIVLTTLLAAPSALSAQHPLRIVSFNVQCLQAPETNASRIGRFRWTPARQAHLDTIASVIESLEPDIIALVEVTSREAVDQLVALLREKGMTGYHGYHVESHDGFSGFDVAFITRVKPDEVEGQSIRTVYSPSGDATWREDYSYVDEEGERKQRNTGLNRQALIYTTIAGRKLAFLGLHLKSDPSSPYANARRTAEAAIAQRIIRTEIVNRGYTPVVLGDLNDYDPDFEDRDPQRSTRTDVIRMFKNFDPTTEGNELFNAGKHIRRIADRYTSHWDVNENGAADVDDVYTMIDHILLPRSFEKHLRRAYVCRLTDLSTSDHWPVVVDLVLPAAAGGQAAQAGITGN
jgi:endonuclease/exonuclease/phosphatase family metal-dependent hydrolase